MKQFIKIKVVKIFLFAFILFAAGITNAQIGIGVPTPNGSAQLDVSSTSKGFLPPRMTQAQRNAITAPAPGLIIWCIDCGLKGELLVYNGAAWTKMEGRTGRNYYVKEKARGGDDADNGLTDSTAWETIARVNTEMRLGKILPGDSILFERGSFFYGTIEIMSSGTAANPIVFGAYGSGTVKPVFILAKHILGSTADWIPLGGNIYERNDGTFNLDVANLVFNNTDSFGQKIMSKSPILSKQGDFWYDFEKHNIQIYSNAGNPAAVYSSIQSVKSFKAITFSQNGGYIVFENLKFKYYGRCVVEAGGSNCSYRNLDISYIGGADQDGDTDTTAEKKNRYKLRFGNGIQMWDDVHDVTVTGCRIDNVYDAGISPQGLSGVSYAVYNIYMRNNVISNCEYSYELFENGGSKNNPKIYTHDIYFENNTCINAGRGWSHNQRWGYIDKKSQPDPNGSHVRLERFDGTTSNVFIRNNLFYGATERLYWIINPEPASIKNIITDYNDFYQTGPEPIGTLLFYTNVNKRDIYTLTEWQQASTKEANSFNVDPLFVSPTDFHLKAGSPLIGKGVDIGYGKYMGAFPYMP